MNPKELTSHAAVATSVELARETAGAPAARYVNAMLRRVAGSAPATEPDGGSSHPDWLRRDPDFAALGGERRFSRLAHAIGAG